MVRKRPCKICRKWFQPHPRAGPRQHTCSRPECQRERHRRNCACWRDRNPDGDREVRLRVRLAGDRPKGPEADLLSWRSARDAVGLEVLAVLEEIRKLLHAFVRDAVARQVVGTLQQSSQVPRTARETASTGSSRPP